MNPEYKGMTLRDWFAGQALSGLLAESFYESFKHAAKDAYELADALLAERQRGGE